MSSEMDYEKVATILNGTDLFSSFSPEELSFLAERSECISLAAGSELFRAGDEAHALFILVSGTIEAVSPENASVVAEFARGDSFGELEFLTGSKRNAHARAPFPAEVIAFPAGGKDLMRSLASRPAVAAGILRSFLRVIAQRTRTSNALVKENSPWVRELRRQVYGDKLTGLLNRAWLEENLPGQLSGTLALIMLKPDNFKEINDRFGHEAGDAVLVLMAAATEACAGSLAKAGTAVRFEGNELAVVFPALGRTAAFEAAKKIQAFLSSLDIREATGDSSMKLRISLGIGLFPEHGRDAATLIQAVSGLPLEGRMRGGDKILFPEDVA